MGNQNITGMDKANTKAEELVNQLRDAAESYEETADGIEYMVGETVYLLNDEGKEVVGVIENEEMGIFDVRVYAQAGDDLLATDEVVYRFNTEMDKYREQPTPENDEQPDEEMDQPFDNEDGDTENQPGAEESGTGEQEEGGDEEPPADEEVEVNANESEDDDDSDTDDAVDDDGVDPDAEEGEEEKAEEDDEDLEEDDEDLEEDDEDEEDGLPKKGMMVTWQSKAGKTYGKLLSKSGDIEVYVKSDGAFVPTTIIVKQDLANVSLADIDVKKRANQLLCKMLEFKMDYDEEKNIGIIEGYASTYGNVDLGGDTVAKGAYKQTLYHKQGRVKLFLDHSWKVSDMMGLSYLEDKEDGLYMKAEMPLDATDVKNAFTKLMFLQERGEQMGLSIGYDAIKSDYAADGTRVLKEIALHEVSVTPFPMDTEANILNARIKRIQYKAMQKQWATNVGNTRDK